MPSASFRPAAHSHGKPVSLEEAGAVSVIRHANGRPTLEIDVGTEAANASPKAQGAPSSSPNSDVGLFALRDGRWWAMHANASVLLNGRAIVEPTRLFDRDVVDLGGKQEYEFVSGEKRTQEILSIEQMVVPPRKRKQSGLDAPRRPIPWKPFAYVGIALIMLAGAIGVFWYGENRTGPAAGTFTDREAFVFDSLIVSAYDHVERGNTLLELGLLEGASQEFARGVNELALSELRTHPQVKPRIAALENSIADIYRAQRMDVPGAYARGRGAPGADELREASLSKSQFKTAFGLVSAAYLARFGTRIVIVGSDHAEHVSLYGKGGALDLRSQTMTPSQVDFVISQCRSHRIRVKDFSQDSILQLQIKAAIRAGFRDRAGTGLHLHIDRFADRRDRWTVGAVVKPEETSISPSPTP